MRQLGLWSALVTSPSPALTPNQNHEFAGWLCDIKSETESKQVRQFKLAHLCYEACPAPRRPASLAPGPGRKPCIAAALSGLLAT